MQITSPLQRRMPDPSRAPVLLLALGVVASVLVVAGGGPAFAATPGNDNFASPRTISGLSGTVNGSNVDATSEVNEPVHAGVSNDASVWYKWTAPAVGGDGDFAFDTCDSNFNTVLAVYSGGTLVNLQEVASNDDASCGTGGSASRVIFTATARAVYRIAVDGNGEMGSFTLTWGAIDDTPPANDDFAGAQAITGPSGTVDGSNDAASHEPGEPDRVFQNPFNPPTTFPAYASIWYRWTAPADGDFVFNTCGTRFDALLAVYTANTTPASVDHLTQVAANDDDIGSLACGAPQSAVRFRATSGVVYYVTVSSFGEGDPTVTGDVDLSWSLAPALATPTLTTTASPSVPVGGQVHDTATLSGGGPSVTGNITFRLYGPNDTTCTAGVAFTSTVAVSGNGSYDSAPFTTATAGTYRWTSAYSGDANNSPATGACNGPNESVVVAATPPGGAYRQLAPTRILDTRNTNSPLSSGSSLDLQVTNAGGVPASGVSAVVGNLTVVTPGTAGWMTVWPTGGAQPLASNVNFGAGRTTPNLVEVPVGTGGRVSIAYGTSGPPGTAHVLFDVSGYVTTPGATGGAGLYNPLSPARIFDTRSPAPTPLSVGSADRTLQVTGAGGVPVTGVSAVALNVTVTDVAVASGEDWLTVYPAGGVAPDASNLNFVNAQEVANRVVVPVSADGKVNLHLGGANGSTANAIVDVGGWFTDASSGAGGARYSGVVPNRILDTRDGGGPVGPNGTISLAVAGTPGIPAMGSAVPPTAVVLNLTAAGTTARSWLTVWPSGMAQPGVSDLNWVAAGDTRANLVVVKVGSDGKVNINNNSGSTNVIVDIEGWYG